MIDVEGIETQTNHKGEITHLTLDVVKYKDILEPLLEQLENKRVSKFEEDWKRGVSVEEARKQTHKFIREMHDNYISLK
jgi:hypothetical protein